MKKIEYTSEQSERRETGKKGVREQGNERNERGIGRSGINFRPTSKELENILVAVTYFKLLRNFF